MKLENGFSKLPDNGRRQHNNKCVSMVTPIHYPMRNMLAIGGPIKSQNYGNDGGSKTAKVKVIQTPQNGGTSCEGDGAKQKIPMYRSSFKFWPKRTKFVCFVEQFKSVSDFPDFVTTGKQVVEEEEILVDLNNNNVEIMNSFSMFPDCYSDYLESESDGDEHGKQEGIVLFGKIKSNLKPDSFIKSSLFSLSSGCFR